MLVLCHSWCSRPKLINESGQPYSQLFLYNCTCTFQQNLLAVLSSPAFFGFIVKLKKKLNYQKNISTVSEMGSTAVRKARLSKKKKKTK